MNNSYISNAIIFLTHKCNLRCPYCFEDHGRTEDVSLSTIDDFYNFVKSSHTLPTTKIEMFGGEPTLNRKAFIYALKTYFNDPDIPGRFFSMTNGTLLTEEYIKEIRDIIDSSKYKNKGFLFYVSIDDISGTVKNLNRVRKTLDLLNKYKINFTVEIVISKLNYTHLFDHVKELLPYGAQDINLRRLCNTSVWSDEEILVIENQCKKIINELDYSRIVFPGKYIFVEQRVIDTYCAAKQHNKYTTHFVDVDGTIYPCEVCASRKKYAMGSIYDPENIKPKKFDVDYYTPTACMLEQYPGNPSYEAMCDRVTSYIIKKHLTVFFEITDKCNYNCSFCCKLWRQEKTGYITDEVLNKIISLKAPAYVIAGGEPCMEREKVRYFVEQTYKGSYLTLNTNLSLWSKEDINFLNIRGVHYTIDFPSYDREEYKKITQTNDFIFNKVKENLSYVGKKQSRVHIVIDEDNRDSWQQTILWLATKYGFTFFVVTPSISFNEPKNKKEIYRAIKNFHDQHANLIMITLANTEDNDCVVVNHKCSAGIDRFVVLADGNIVPCAWSRNHIIGHILKDNLDDILIRGRQYFYSYPYEKLDICKGILDAQEEANARSKQ